jgi:hypothetical protein
MGRMVMQGVLNAVALWIVSWTVSGFVVSGWGSAARQRRPGAEAPNRRRLYSGA